MPIISALGRLKQEDCPEFQGQSVLHSEFKASLDNRVRPRLKTKKEKEKTDRRVVRIEGCISIFHMQSVGDSPPRFVLHVLRDKLPA